MNDEVKSPVLRKNHVYQVVVDALSHEGRGIASIAGQRIFIEGALIGEEVTIKLCARKKKVWNATVESIQKKSPIRVTPPCEFATICGGCSLQHMALDAQRDVKEAALKNQMLHFGQCQLAHLEPVLVSESLGYRKKARLGVRYVVKKNKVLVGFREKNAPYLADMNRCEVVDPRVGHKIAEIQALIYECDGRSTIPQIEVAASQDEVALIVRHLEPFSPSDLNRFIAFAQKNKIQLYLQPAGPTSVHRVWPETDRPERLYYMVDGLKLAFHPLDFTQINNEINVQMVARAMEWLDLDGQDQVLDLFCGLGNFTLPIANRAGRVIGIEGSDVMVARGYENAKGNNLTTVDFLVADLFAENSLDIVPWGEFGEDDVKVLLDPPRSGAESVVRQLLHKPVKRIVYISCNAATLARDTAILQNGGFQCVKAGMMDMFPHTHHMESIALFQRN